MWAMLFPIFAGFACVLLGISNMKGNIKSLHKYHRSRVSEEDRLPFGRKVGLGTIIIGVAVIIFSALLALGEYTGQTAVILVGNGILIAGLVTGLALSFYAMIKYNKGIF